MKLPIFSMVLLFCLLTFHTTTWAHNGNGDDRITIFLDCNFCNTSQIKQELDYVNFAIDLYRSDVHVFMTRQSLANGAHQYFVEVLGIDEWQDERVTFKFASDPNMSSLEQNDLIIGKIKIGLAPFLAKTTLVDQIELRVPEIEQQTTVAEELTFWENWIYDLGGNIRWDAQAARQSIRASANFDSDNVSNAWRHRFRASFSYREDRFQQNESEIKAIRRSSFTSYSVVKSITDHWSAGLFASHRTSDFDNIDRSIWMSPAIEYNIFPYDDVPAREFTIAYRIGLLDRKYIEETIYLQTEEQLLRQSLNADLRLRKTWGNVFLGLSGSNFFDDWTKNNVQLNGSFSVRVFKGLAVNLSGNYRIINDQISLPRQEATLEELLLSQRQLATNFSSRVSFGLNYTFGALYNNIINTRL